MTTTTEARHAAALAELQALYDSLPPVQCRGVCVDSCTVIGASELEHAQLRARGVDLGPKMAHRQLLELVTLGATPRCPALSPLGTCRVYDVRPLICRLFGAAQGLRCQHGCEPEWELTDAEAGALLHRTHELSAEAGL